MNIYKLEESQGDNKEEGVAKMMAFNSWPQAETPDRDRGIFFDPSYDRFAAKNLPLFSGPTFLFCFMLDSFSAFLFLRLAKLFFFFLF